MDSDENLAHLKSVKQLSQKHPTWSEGGLRHIIFHKDTNGFAECIYKVGKRVLIHEGKFFACIERQNTFANA